MLTRRRCAAAIAALIAVAAVLVVSTTVALAMSNSSPADKVVAAGDRAVVATPVGGGGTSVELLRAIMKTSKPTDLVLNVSLECSILTTVTVTGSPTGTTNSAQGQVRVWTEVDGQVVPITSVSDPPQNTPAGGTKADDSAVFCERLHQVTFINPEDMGDPQDTIREYQETKNANAFNWLRFNVGAGTHTVTVKADLTASATMPMDATNTQAIVGNRTLVVTPTKMANDAVISNPGTG
jgi:hypothetical protein